MKLLPLLVLLLSFNAMGIDPAVTPIVTVNCTMPTTRIDGELLRVEEIAAVTLLCRTNGNYEVKDTNNICQLDFDISQLPDGDYSCVTTATDLAGRESRYSTEFVLPVKSLTIPSPPVCCTISL